MRKIIKIIVLLALIYFAVGLIIAKSNLVPYFTYQIYLELSTIVGSTASIFGLLALGIPALTTKDLKELELESLKEVVSLAEDMKKADDELLKRSSEIDQLEQKKKRMELLMRKACMSIHLNDKHKDNIERLIKIYKENKSIESRLCALDEEIEQSGDQQLIKEIMNMAESKMSHESERIESFNSLFELKPNFLGIGINLNAIINDLLEISRKK
jgi:hypothetical protein